MFGFHRTICAAAGPITQSTLDMLYARVGLLESVYARKSDPAVATAEHREIVDALRAGDYDKGAKLNEDHWQHGYADIVALINET